MSDAIQRPLIETAFSTTFTCTMSPEARARLLRMCCEGQLDRLEKIETLLAGDLSTYILQHDVCMHLAQFGDYEDGERFHLYVTSLFAARDYAQRVLPGCRITTSFANNRVMVRPPPDERLTVPERSGWWAQIVEPHANVDPEALALLRVVVRLMKAIVRSDLAKYVSETNAMPEEA